MLTCKSRTFIYLSGKWERAQKKILSNDGNGIGGGGGDDDGDDEKGKKIKLTTLSYFQNGLQYHKIQEIITNKSNWIMFFSIWNQKKNCHRFVFLSFFGV